jgi:hypothetical protein
MNLEKYPIIIGAIYINTDNETGVLESAKLISNKNDVIIVINTNNCGKFFKINYATFTYYWRLYKT